MAINSSRIIIRLILNILFSHSELTQRCCLQIGFRPRSSRHCPSRFGYSGSLLIAVRLLISIRRILAASISCLATRLVLLSWVASTNIICVSITSYAQGWLSRDHRAFTGICAHSRRCHRGTTILEKFNATWALPSHLIFHHNVIFTRRRLRFVNDVSATRNVPVRCHLIKLALTVRARHTGVLFRRCLDYRDQLGNLGSCVTFFLQIFNLTRCDHGFAQTFRLFTPFIIFWLLLLTRFSTHYSLTSLCKLWFYACMGRFRSAIRLMGENLARREGYVTEFTWESLVFGTTNTRASFVSERYIFAEWSLRCSLNLPLNNFRLFLVILLIPVNVWVQIIVFQQSPISRLLYFAQNTPISRRIVRINFRFRPTSHLQWLPCLTTPHVNLQSVS